MVTHSTLTAAFKVRALASLPEIKFRSFYMSTGEAPIL